MLQVKLCVWGVAFLLIVPSMAFSKATTPKTVYVQPAKNVEQKEETKDIFTGVSIYTIEEDDDEEDVYDKALLDAKRDAVEQAGTYIEITTNMRNYVITTDDVNVLSAAIVKLIPGSIKQQVVSEVGGIKTIRLEAQFHVDTKHLENGLFPNRGKELQVSVSRDSRGIYLTGEYNIFKDKSYFRDAILTTTIGYDSAYRPILASFSASVFQDEEHDAPVIISSKHPMRIKLYANGGIQERLFMNPTYHSGSTAFLNVDSLGVLSELVLWTKFDKVCLEFYQKGGNTYKIVIPRKVLNQWRDMAVNPRKVVAEYEE